MESHPIAVRLAHSRCSDRRQSLLLCPGKWRPNELTLRSISSHAAASLGRISKIFPVIPGLAKAATASAPHAGASRIQARKSASRARSLAQARRVRRVRSIAELRLGARPSLAMDSGAQSTLAEPLPARAEFADCLTRLTYISAVLATWSANPSKAAFVKSVWAWIIFSTDCAVAIWGNDPISNSTYFFE